MGRVEVQMYPGLHLALGRGGWMMPDPTTLPPEWRDYRMYRKLDELIEQSGQMKKSLEFKLYTAQPAASHHTNYVIQLPNIYLAN
jgi:beta-glucanase (GH16 family)